MTNFDESFEKVILVEGGYVNDPDDAGGETYLGISRKNNPKWSGWVTIDNLKNKYPATFKQVLKETPELTEKAKLLYKSNYWDALSLDDIYSQKIADELFDTAVNMGVKQAVRIAEHVVGMTVTGKFSDELLYNLKEYGKDK